MRVRAMPANEPSNPAIGMARRTALPAKDRNSLMTPMDAVAAMPRYQVCRPAVVGSNPAARNFAYAGPSTNSVMPMVDGVSMPKGIAVTSLRPVRRASLTASHVYTKSPTSTPQAVPGHILPKTISPGTPYAPMSTAASRPSTDRLSTTRPRKPLISPGTSRKKEIAGALVTKVEQGRVAAGGRGIHRQSALIGKSREIVRTARFRTGARQPVAAKGLYADDCADHIAVDVGITDRSVCKDLPPERFETRLHPQR